MSSDFKIVPAVAPTPNGDVALLTWHGGIDAQILSAIHRQSDLVHYSAIGYTNTNFGGLAWAFFFVDTKANFSNPQADLFYFDLIVSPPELKTDTTLKRWLQCFRVQDPLSLSIPYSSAQSRITTLLRRQQLQEYISHLERAIAQWQPTNNYTLAVQSFSLESSQKQGLDYIGTAYRSQNPAQRLLIDFAQSCINELTPEHQLHSFASEDKLRSLEQFLKRQLEQMPPVGNALNQYLSTVSDDAADNLIRDYAFAKNCLSPEGRSAPMIAVGLTDTNKWRWRKIPFEGDVDALWFYSRAYRCLLSERQWWELVEHMDVPVPALNLLSIRNLGTVPDRKQFQETSKVLRLAILQKQYGISARSTIVVGKKGLDSISFFPLDQESRYCLFKVVLEPNNRQGYNLCLFGRLDAAKGTIKPVGIAESIQTQKPLRLLLFLVAVAYRDLIVTREQLEIENSTNKQNKKAPKHSRSNGIPLLARLKRSSKNLDEQFADSQRFLEEIKKIAPRLRVEHLRELPSGSKASQKQRELAESYGFLLPEGFTFVSPSLVGDKEGSDASEVYKQFRSLSILQMLFN